MKLLLFVSVDKYGHNKLLACALLTSEDLPTFEWCYEQFHAAFGELSPTVIFSDGDSAMINAVKAVSAGGGIWEGIVQLRCVFHLWKNFFQYLLKYYIGNSKAWSVVARRFWKFIHETDAQLLI
jgi:hypothetical protein